MNNIVNLTPHAIVIVRENGNITIPPSGNIARVSTMENLMTYDGHIPIYDQTYGDTTGLPEMQPDTRYLVSSMVRLANPDRWDLLSPAGLVRDDNGQPIGCVGLVTNAFYSSQR